MTEMTRARAGSRLTRRRFLEFGAGLSSVAAAGSLLAQTPSPATPPPATPPPATPAVATSPPRAKGPPVWLDLDQAELDAAYDQSKYAPNIQQVLKRYASNSEVVRSKLGAPLNAPIRRWLRSRICARRR